MNCLTACAKICDVVFSGHRPGNVDIPIELGVARCMKRMPQRVRRLNAE